MSGTGQMKQLVPIGLRAEGRAADGAFPDGGDEGADFEVFGGDEVGDFFQVILGGVGVGVWVEKEVVDAVVFLSADFGVGSEFEHALEGDGRVVGAFFFADETGPHGVMNFE